MRVGVFLNYIGLGANIMHLSYCHEIAKIYGPITLITLAKNLDQALEDDESIKEVIILEKNKKITDILKISSKLKKLKLDQIYIFYPSPRLFLAGKIAGIKKVFSYSFFKKKKLHLVDAAKKFTCEKLKINNCDTETKFQISEKKIFQTKKFFNPSTFNIVIGAGSSGPDTRWGEENFINLINKLNQISEFFFYIQAGPNQKDISEKL